MARRTTREDAKTGELRAGRCLNPRPESVRDEAFGGHEFFDARDVVQVKYEMVRRMRVDGASVTEATAAFEYSRPSFYEAAAALDAAGLDGLVRPNPARGRATNSPTRSARSPRSGGRRPGAAGQGPRGPDRGTVRGTGASRSIERALVRYRGGHSKRG